MEDEQHKERQGDQTHCHRAHYNQDGGVDGGPRFVDEVHDHVDEEHAEAEHHAGQEQHEEPVVALPHAVVDKGAVMVPHFDAVVAGGAVAGTRWPEDFAGLAEFQCFIPIATISQIFLVPLRLPLQKCPPGDNARVCALRHVQKNYSQSHSNKQQDRQGSVDCPYFGDDEEAVRHQSQQDAEIHGNVGEAVAGGSHDAAGSRKPVAARPNLVEFPHLDYNRCVKCIIMGMRADSSGDYKRSLKKVLYILLLMAILSGTIIYLDMHNELGLQNIASVILGFVIMLFVQLRLINFYLGDKMEEYNLDEFGIVKDQIRSKVFGEINKVYIDKKSKIKYYQHTKDENDKLFASENEEIFDCVMTTLRAKNQGDHSKRIRVLRDKWEVFLIKIDQFQIFLTKLHKLYKQRSLNFKKFENKIGSIAQEDYDKWSALFTHSEVAGLDPSKKGSYSRDYFNSGEWIQMKIIVQDRQRMVETKTKDIASQLLTQFKLYANQMRAQSKQTLTELANSENECAESENAYREILEKIKATKLKIEQLNDKIKASKAKGSQNVESIFDTEYDLRFLFVEVDNLEVRKTYTKDLKYKASQSQYKLCILKQNSFENTGLMKFNNKISHYLGNYYDNILTLKKPFEREERAEEPLLNDQDIEKGDYNKASNHIAEIHRRMQQFKLYLANLITLFQDEVKVLKKISTIIKQSEQQARKSPAYEKNLVETGIRDKIIDNSIFEVLKIFSGKQITILSNCVYLLKGQEEEIEKKEDKKRARVMDPPKNRKIAEQNSPLVAYIKQTYFFEQTNKMTSKIGDIISYLVENYDIIKRQLNEKKEALEMRIRLQLEADDRASKMNEYKDQLFKSEGDGLFGHNSDHQQEEQEERNKSLKLVNKILTVFINEWKNSQFFHGILKEEIQVALNIKRPPFLGYMSVKHIKLHEKQGDLLESLSVLGDNLFMCLFQVGINFQGKVAVHIQTEIKGRKIPLNIQLLITEFRCPVRVCLTPFSLGKSYVSLMKAPHLRIQFCAKLGGWNLTNIPFMALIIEIFLVIKLRKKLLYPKKGTVKVPLAVKNAVSEAIKQSETFQKLLEKKMKTN